MPEYVQWSEYVRTKAELFNHVGAARYAAGDAFRYPLAAWGDETLAAIARGMAQIADGAGLSRERPLDGLRLSEVVALAQTLHFAFVMQANCNGVDEVHLRHLVNPGPGLTMFLAVHAIAGSGAFEDLDP